MSCSILIKSRIYKALRDTVSLHLLTLEQKRNFDMESNLKTAFTRTFVVHFPYISVRVRWSWCHF
ncbi:MAG TPA: hypothetical protein VFM28_04280 [Nitrososphaeraceae archaeon]|nr:hypothetical protein [Nitrososphaeraceae archaeon]